MKLNLIPLVLALSWAVRASPASAQLLAAKDAPIAYGHHHLNVTSIAELIDVMGHQALRT